MFRRITVLSLSCFFGFTALVAAPSAETKPTVGRAAGPVALGATKTRLVDLLGMPSEIVGPDLWIYREFPYHDPIVEEAGYDTLIVRVIDDRVVLIKLVNGEDLNALIRAHTKPRQVFAVTEPPRRK